MSKKDFEDPNVPEPQEEEIEAVDEQGSVEDPAVSQASEQDDTHDEMDEELSADDEQLIQVKADLDEQLGGQTAQISAAGFECAESMTDASFIRGFGIGTPELDFVGPDPNRLSLNVYVAEPMDMEQVRRSLKDDMACDQAADDDFPINVIYTGEVEAQSHRFRMRPAPCGVSTGHVRVTAGTLGVLARGKRGSRRRRVLVLSNNHVLANSNAGRAGDAIVQPGTADGGRSPRDRIAILERFVRIRFDGSPNYVDCATGWAWHDRVDRRFVYLQRGRRRLFRISSRVRACRRGMLVGKSGRTTQLTVGRVIDCSATIRVNFGRGRIALFRDQIAIRGLRGNFSAGGDSGSCIWSWDSRRNPIGLLFAGGGGVTFANKMSRVLRALDIDLYT